MNSNAKQGITLCSLASLCSLISSGGTPSRAKPYYFTNSDAGNLWVKSKELIDGPIITTEERITDEAIQNSSAKFFPSDTILMAMYGANVGQLGILRQKATVNQAICGLIINNKLADSKYVFYSLLFKRRLLISKAFGAAQQNLNQELIRSFEIPCHSLPTQHKIAAILSAYDALIENNQQRIKILEEMAQMIYREWFVKFRFPGHEKIKMVDSRLGMIPEGWEVKPIGEVIQTLGGGTPSTKIPEYWTKGNVTWFTPSDLTKANSMFIFNSEKRLTDKGLTGSSAKMFPPYSVMMTSRATIGVVAMNTKESCTNQGFIVCLPNKVIPSSIVYYWIFENKDRIDNLASGATYKEISRGEFRELLITVPVSQITDLFQQIITPIFSEIENVLKRNINLRTTRDMLLPKLISGEIDVSDLDIKIEKAA